jgi:hypothetical protein
MRSVGWAGRGVFDEQMLDPDIIWRHLQFQRLKISIRDPGLTGLNQMLDRAGDVLGFEARLQLTDSVDRRS